MCAVLGGSRCRGSGDNRTGGHNFNTGIGESKKAVLIDSTLCRFISHLTPHTTHTLYMCSLTAHITRPPHAHPSHTHTVYV